ncbi:unnamed protein product, partial [Brassica oleracea]
SSDFDSGLQAALVQGALKDVSIPPGPRLLILQIKAPCRWSRGHWFETKSMYNPKTHYGYDN